MKLKLLIALLLLAGLKAAAQDSVTLIKPHTNPIIFGEFELGGAGGSASGFSFGGTLNYQAKHGLFTYRLTDVSSFYLDNSLWFIGIPLLHQKTHLTEHAFMYGYRITNGGFSFSASAGISHNQFSFHPQDNGAGPVYFNRHWGIPFEANVKWFNAVKRRYRIYYIIPVTKPTSLSRSIGFKFYGNISRNGYMGLGLTYGLGWHKNY